MGGFLVFHNWSARDDVKVERARGRARMSRLLPDSIIDAAVILDLDSLRRAVSGGASVDQLSGRSAGGITIVHGLAAGFHFFKAGELSSLVDCWRRARQCSETRKRV